MQQPYQPVQQSYQQAAPVQQPKKKNKGLIIGIVAGVLVVLAAIGAIAQKAAQNQCIAHTPAMANILKAVGYSYDYPVYNNDGSVNMDKSRRVTFTFVLTAK